MALWTAIFQFEHKVKAVAASFIINSLLMKCLLFSLLEISYESMGNIHK